MGFFSLLSLCLRFALRCRLATARSPSGCCSPPWRVAQGYDSTGRGVKERQCRATSEQPSAARTLVLSTRAALDSLDSHTASMSQSAATSGTNTTAVYPAGGTTATFPAPAYSTLVAASPASSSSSGGGQLHPTAIQVQPAHTSHDIRVTIHTASDPDAKSEAREGASRKG